MIEYKTLTSSAEPQEHIIIPYILIGEYWDENNILVGIPVCMLEDDEEYYYSVT